MNQQVENKVNNLLTSLKHDIESNFLIADRLEYFCWLFFSIELFVSYECLVRAERFVGVWVIVLDVVVCVDITDCRLDFIVKKLDEWRKRSFTVCKINWGVRTRWSDWKRINSGKLIWSFIVDELDWSFGDGNKSRCSVSNWRSLIRWINKTFSESFSNKLSCDISWSSFCFILFLFDKLLIYSCLLSIAGADSAMPGETAGLISIERWLEAER